MRQSARIIFGFLLIFGGIFFFLNNLGLVTFGNLIWAAVLGAAGIGFLAAFVLDRTIWWTIIPGLTLLGTGLTIGVSELFPEVGDWLGEVFILGGIGASFLIIYLIRRSNWWAIIPSGTLLTLAVVSVVEGIFTGLETGGLFFIGLGLTFTVLYFVPTPDGRMNWAIFPAGGLILFGLVVSAAAFNIFNFIWPAAIIIAGLYLIYRNMNESRSS
jgi:hypothetical protein